MLITASCNYNPKERGTIIMDAYDNRENWYILLVSIMTGKGQEKAAKLMGFDDLTGRSTAQKARRTKPRSYYDERDKAIYTDFAAGMDTKELSIKYDLPLNSVRKGIRRYCARHGLDRVRLPFYHTDWTKQEYLEDCEEWQ